MYLSKHEVASHHHHLRSLNSSRWKHPGPRDREPVRLGPEALDQLNVLLVAMEMIAGHIRSGIAIDVALHMGKGVLGNGPGLEVICLAL